MAARGDPVKESCDDHINPARPAEIVGEAPAADRAQLDAVVTAARNAAAGWRALDVGERADGIRAFTQARGYVRQPAPQ